MSYENTAGLGVNNQYGVRDTQDGAAISGGEVEGGGAQRDYVAYFTGDEIGSVAFDTGLIIPAGHIVVGAILKIEDAITMGNPDNDINIGLVDNPVSDGVRFDNTDGVAGAYAAAVYNGSFGDGASGPASQAGGSAFTGSVAVSIIVTGTDPENTSGGKGKVVITTRKA